MAVVFRFSGGEFNTNPNASLGGIISNTALTSNQLENFFDNVKRNESLVGRTEHRMLYVLNTGGSHVSGVTIELATNPALTRASIGLDPAGKGDGTLTGVGVSITSETDTPTGVKFFGEDSLSADGPWDTVRMPLGLLEAGEAVPVWFKRVTEKGAQQIVTFQIDVNHEAVTLPGEDVDDGGSIGELVSVTKKTTGTFVVGTAKVGFSDIG